MPEITWTILKVTGAIVVSGAALICWLECRSNAIRAESLADKNKRLAAKLRIAEKELLELEKEKREWEL